MRIAVITTSFPSLSETFILDQVTGLLDLGYDVRILAWRDPGDSVLHPGVAQYELSSRTRYIPRVPQGKFVRLMKAAQLIIANLHRSPGPLLRFVGMFLRRKRGLSLAHLYFLLYLTEADFDVILCQYGPNGLIGAFLKQVGAKSKVCTVFHGFDVSRYPLTHGRDVYDELFNAGDLFMPVSEYWKSELTGMGCPPERTIVHRMGIDLKKFTYCPRSRRPGVPVRLLTVGRLVEKKGHRYAIEAVARLIAAGYDVEYAVAGDGPLKEDLQRLAEERQIQSRVRFLGAVDQHRALELYREADIFVLPSVRAEDGDMEGVPVVLMEAMASGVPVVSTRHSGIPELVIDGESGLLADERDADGLSQRLSGLVNDPANCIEISLRARQRIEDEFNLNRLNCELATRLVELAGVV